MRGLVLLLAVVVTVVVSHPHHKKRTPEYKACHDLLKPLEDKETRRATADLCIAEQTGLQATIDELRTAAEAASTSTHSHERGGRRGRSGNPIRVLQKAGKTAEVATLNQCIARENGHLLVAADGTTSFDVTKFKDEVAARVAGTSSLTNTQLGLDSCPTTDLDAYDVHEYMECLEAYCATGVAPVPRSPEVTK